MAGGSTARAAVHNKNGQEVPGDLTLLLACCFRGQHGLLAARAITVAVAAAAAERRGR
jgi:hypothetical protein